jgi:Na+(H+)/acetate symporter ActP
MSDMTSSNWLSNGIKVAQDYLVHNTTLGISALVETEGDTWLAGWKRHDIQFSN